MFDSGQRQPVKSAKLTLENHDAARVAAGHLARSFRPIGPAAGRGVVFEGPPTPMWVFDLDTHRFLAVNAAAVAEYGYPPEKFLALIVRDVYGEADLVRFDGLARDAAQELHTGDWIHRRQDGTLLRVEIRSSDLSFQSRRARLMHVTNVTHVLTLRRRVSWQRRRDARPSKCSARLWNRVTTPKAVDCRRFVDQDAAAPGGRVRAKDVVSSALRSAPCCSRVQLP
jgi:hypothetical protein